MNKAQRGMMGLRTMFVELVLQVIVLFLWNFRIRCYYEGYGEEFRIDEGHEVGDGDGVVCE